MGHIRIATHLDQEKPSPSLQAYKPTKLQQPRGQKPSNDVREGHGSPEERQPHGQLVGLIEVAEIQDDLFPLCQPGAPMIIHPPFLHIINHHMDEWLHGTHPWKPTSGMKPPSQMANRTRVTRKVALSLSQNWLMDTMLQRHICIGTHRSGPIHLLSTCDGSSAQRKANLKRVFPRL